GGRWRGTPTMGARSGSRVRRASAPARPPRRSSRSNARARSTPPRSRCCAPPPAWPRRSAARPRRSRRGVGSRARARATGGPGSGGRGARGGGARWRAAGAEVGWEMEVKRRGAGLMFVEGWVKENLGDAAGAIELYKKHLEVHTQDMGTRRRLVGLYAREQRYAEAYDEARRVGQTAPDEPEALQIQADLALKLKKTEEAERLL